MELSTQLIFDLPHIPALGSEDFFVSASNEKAVRLVEAWPDWPNAVAVIAGPQGSGKTHLVNVWRARSGAEAFAATDVARAVDRALGAGGPVILEDIDATAINEHAAFHLLNLARERGFEVLITARRLPGEWHVSLPDLRSRLRSAALVTIDAPDEALLGAVLIKLFADRQLAIEPGVIGYVMRRMVRSMAAAQRLVDALDRAALAEHRRVTKALAAKLLHAEGADDGADGRG